MSFAKRIYLTCDHCVARHETQFFHDDDPGAIRDLAAKGGWSYVDDEDLCPSCSD